MSKRIKQQHRGRGGPTYRAPSHRYFGELAYPALPAETKIMRGEIIDIVNSVGHSAPLMIIDYEDGQSSLTPAPIGVRMGQEVYIGEAESNVGNIVPLGKIPVGTHVFNLERRPFDKGKLIRTAGSAAFIVGKEKGKVIVQLPSKKKLSLNSNCLATIGIIAGSGHKTKPLMKAGKNFHKKKARNKKYPIVKGVAMNAVSHPHGGTHSRNTGRPTTRKRDLPPGKKVGLIAARRTGRTKK